MPGVSVTVVSQHEHKAQDNVEPQGGSAELMAQQT
jgi:hypothetical protein